MTKTSRHTHVTGLQVGLLGTDQDGCISDGCVPVLHLLILLFIFVLAGQEEKNNILHGILCISSLLVTTRHLYFRNTTLL